MQDSELYVELEDYYHSKGADRAIWHLKTYPEVKAGQVFDLMDRNFEIFLSDSCKGIEPVDGKFTFSELTDTTQDRLNRLISPDSHNPGFNTFSGSDFVIHVTESDDIFLNGKPQSSTVELVENLATQYNSEKGSKVYVAVDDEVLWSKALEVGRRLRDKDLWMKGGIYRSNRLAEMEAARHRRQSK